MSVQTSPDRRRTVATDAHVIPIIFKGAQEIAAYGDTHRHRQPQPTTRPHRPRQRLLIPRLHHPPGLVPNPPHHRLPLQPTNPRRRPHPALRTPPPHLRETRLDLPHDQQASPTGHHHPGSTPTRSPDATPPTCEASSSAAAGEQLRQQFTEHAGRPGVLILAPRLAAVGNVQCTCETKTKYGLVFMASRLSTLPSASTAAVRVGGVDEDPHRPAVGVALDPPVPAPSSVDAVDQGETAEQSRPGDRRRSARRSGTRCGRPPRRSCRTARSVAAFTPR